MKITVTQAHIEAGLAKKCTQCPLALAIVSATGKAAEVTYGHATIGRKTIELPAVAASFVRRFDIHGRDGVQPFSFELEVPA